MYDQCRLYCGYKIIDLIIMLSMCHPSVHQNVCVSMFGL